MIKTVKTFERDNHILVVDTTSGERVVTHVPKGPGLARRMANYTKAKASHVVRGSPKASLEAIKKRFAICQRCPSGNFLPVEPKKRPASLIDLEIVGTCNDMQCGCFLHPTEIEPAKLAWADQECPEKHWGKAVSVSKN